MNEKFKKAIQILCDSTLITYDDLVSKSRKHEMVVARQLLVTAMFERGYTLRQSGSVIGNMSHDLVLYSKKVFYNLLETSPEVNKKYGPILKDVMKAIPARGPKVTDRVYLCGQVTGIEYEEAVVNFKAAFKKLQRGRYSNIYNPLENKNYLLNNKDTNKYCLFRLLSCKCIYVMPDAYKCEQARIEISVAKNTGIKVITDNDIYY